MILGRDKVSAFVSRAFGIIMRKPAAQKNRTLRASSGARITAEQFAGIESALRVEEGNQRSALIERLLADIEPVRFYEDGSHFGFGFRKSDGKLVEWNIPAKHTVEFSEASSWESEITLAESLEWVKAMLFAEQRFDSCMQTGDAYAKWIDALRLALLATAKP